MNVQTNILSLLVGGFKDSLKPVRRLGRELQVTCKFFKFYINVCIFSAAALYGNFVKISLSIVNCMPKRPKRPEPVPVFVFIFVFIDISFHMNAAAEWTLFQFFLFCSVEHFFF